MPGNVGNQNQARLSDFRRLADHGGGSIRKTGDNKIEKQSSKVADFFRRVFNSSGRKQANIDAVNKFKQELTGRYGENNVPAEVKARLDTLARSGKSLKAGEVKAMLGKVESAPEALKNQPAGRMIAAAMGTAKGPDMTGFVKSMGEVTDQVVASEPDKLMSFGKISQKAGEEFRAEMRTLSPAQLIRLRDQVFGREFAETKEQAGRDLEQLGGSIDSVADVQLSKLCRLDLDLFEEFSTAVMDECDRRNIPPHPPEGAVMVAGRDVLERPDVAASQALCRDVEAKCVDWVNMTVDKTMNAIVSHLPGDVAKAGAELSGLRDSMGISAGASGDKQFENMLGDLFKNRAGEMMKSNPDKAHALMQFCGLVKMDPVVSGQIDGMKNPPPPMKGLDPTARSEHEKLMQRSPSQARGLEFMADKILEGFDQVVADKTGVAGFKTYGSEITANKFQPTDTYFSSFGASPQQAKELGAVFSEQFMKDLIRMDYTFDGQPLKATLADLTNLRARFAELNGGDQVKGDQALRNLTLYAHQGRMGAFETPLVMRAAVPSASEEMGGGGTHGKTVDITSGPNGQFHLDVRRDKRATTFAMMGREMEPPVILDVDKSTVRTEVSFTIRLGTDRDHQMSAIITDARTTIHGEMENGAAPPGYNKDYNFEFHLND